MVKWKEWMGRKRVLYKEGIMEMPLDWGIYSVLGS